MRKNKLCLGVVLFCVLAGTATLSRADVIFSDDFESHVAATSWVEPNDRDPGAPPVGAGWTIDESEETMTQVMRSPVSSSYYKFDTPYGLQYLHMWRDSSGSQSAWAGLTTDAQNQVAANGTMRVELKAHNVSGFDGWGGSLNIGGFDSAPGSYANRAFDISLRSNGEVWLYTGSSVKNTALDAVFDCNTWESLVIDVDFVTDTWSLTIDGVTVGSLGFEAGDLSKIQYVSIGMTDYSGAAGRGGIDDLVVLTPVPEPATLGLLAVGGLGIWIRKKR
ncbi:MAG: PEP-CTERM sorting domain-containing protein [Phycisphaerae bacterium]|nr:PEP-CTERM sorting domain-containing protein [Phycisphaerae bacterium]